MSRLGSPRLHLRRTDSTNLRARGLAGAGAPHGTLVTAERQDAGRGRQGRRWSTPPGQALLASLVLRDPPPRLALVAGVAVAELAERLDAAGRRAAVKWPNDVLLDGAKVAGILVEGRPQQGWAVLGIGLNVAVELASLEPAVARRAATLGRPAQDLEPALDALLDGLGHWLSADPGQTLDALRDRDALRGRPVRFGDGRGVGAGIDDAGRLRVDTGEGILALEAGEVHLGPDPG
jgi:BirA family transcriptional regulator, biotin operon repressor / biotin---[acetyl-CoA-carboxylase] ligase